MKSNFERAFRVILQSHWSCILTFEEERTKAVIVDEIE
jgi:hypothetical protein